MFRLSKIVTESKIDDSFKRKFSMYFDQGLGGLFIRNQVVDQTGFQGCPDGVDLFLTAADQKNLVDPCEIIQRDANDNIIFTENRFPVSVEVVRGDHADRLFFSQ